MSTMLLMHRRSSSAVHLLLISCLVVGAVLLWMLPLLSMGQTYDIYPLLLARNFSFSGNFYLTDELGRFLAPHLLANSGIITAADGRLSAMLFAKISSFIPWGNSIGWAFVASATMALSVVAWWLTIVKIFDRRIAWISSVIIVCMPLYWRQAVWLDNYNFAFLFLFLSFFAFTHLYHKSRWVALLVSGLLFGLSVASKDAFLIFIPWFVIGFAWMHHSSWLKIVTGVAIFGACAGSMYLMPYVGDIQQLGYPMNQNLAHFWPSSNNFEDGIYLHLYPDPYTYYFDLQTWHENRK